MTRKRLIALVLIMSLAAWGVIANSGPAAAAPAHPFADGSTSTATSTSNTPPASCAAPPDNADATTANRDRFIALWGPRIADKAWFSTFANAATVPSDVLAEGFHAMDEHVQAWLVACLVDNLLAATSQQATPDQLAHYQVGLDIVIFGKKQIATAKDQLQNSTAPAQGPTVPTGDLTAQHLSDTQKALANDPGVTSASIPKIDATAIATSKSTNLGTGLSSRLQDLTSSASPAPTKAKATASPSTQNATQQTINPNALLNKLGTILNQPLAALILSAINDLLQIVAQIQAILFTLPVVNVLATLFYRVCAESASQPLACSIYLPVGVPVPVDVTGDNFPDVLAELLPIIDVTSVGIDVSVQFGYSKIITNSTPLPAHIFVVYDPPIINKRIEFGYDGRASTLANSTQTLFTLHNAYAALTGDISVSMQTTSNKPGSTEALTFAIKDLIGGSAGHPATEANPMAGAVQFSPFPTKLTANAHLTHTGGQDEDIVSIQSSTPATVNAVINQDTTTTTPKSHRQFTALIDQLPTSVQVDLVHQGQKQVITYTASAAINHVNATDTATPDITHAGSFTQSIYDVLGVPASVKVTLQGAQDILYAASAKIPQVTFSTQTQVDNVLQQQITAQAHQIPMNIHVTNITTPDQQAVTYDADSVLQDVQFSMYDRSQDKTNLIASAQSIPTHIQFSQTKSKGIFDFQANAGIGVINATFTRNEGTVLHLPGDHATVHKVGNQLALELQLTGFQAAHFDGSQKTIVSMNLSPGGQSFDALADMDSPNILASVHVSQLPSTMSVTIDPVGGAATYSASSIIPDLHGSFIQRDTQTIGDFALTNIPKNVQVNWNIAGSAPQITYAADSRLGAIEAFYQKAPGDLSFHGLISNLPQYMLISGQDPITFDARTASNASPASSFIGQITFDYATDGTFESPSPATPDDHVLLDTTMGQTHAQLVYSGLSFIKASTTGQQLHIEVKNTTPRFFRAFLTTDDIVATGFIDKVPADVKIDQVGNTISYNASDPIHEIFTQAQRANGDSIQADVMDIPNSITLLFDAANSTLDWHASDVTGSISALAHLTGATLGTTRNFDAALTIAGIPRHWFATYPNGNVDFEADGAGIGSIDARVTNHVTYHTLTGDHLTAFFDQPSGDLDATLHISNLTKAAFSKLGGTNGGGFSADLNMGSHGAFAFSGDVTLNSNVKLLATGSFDNLPALIHVQSLNGRIQYTGDSNPTLNLSVSAGDAGALGVTPTPPNIHGVSVRDGSSGGQNAYKANVFLTGLPDSLDLNTPAGTYSVGNYHPSIDALNVDAVLTTIAPVPLSLELTQHIGTSQPVDFKFGPFQSSTAPDGTHSLSLNYTASRQLGSLDAEAIYGNTDDAHLFIS
ncbi:MAG: hypothetical protein QOG80_2906, partial [Pseudonocardiales bacterium]|nr:hypothetical protein [Pseudonocardiales bacterium]